MTDPATPGSSTPVLSICVPTYNRAGCLPALLDSIVEDIARLPAPWTVDTIEVVVSDNASTDNTAEVISAYRTQLPHLVYVRHAENMGADRNFLAAVEAASGRWCWLMGSDDKVEAQALARVLAAGEAWPDHAGFSVNVAQYDPDLTVRMPLTVEPLDFTGDVDMAGAETIFETFGTSYGYLSAQVVRSDLWDAVCATGEPLEYLNAYVQVFVIGRMLQRVPRWGYVHQRCVGWRSGNDSFLDKGWVRRLEIDLLGYPAVAAGLFGKDSATAHSIRDQISARHAYGHYRWAKLRGESGASLHAAAQLLKTHLHDSPVYRRKLLPWIVLPGFAVSGIYRLYRSLLRDRVRARRLIRQRRGESRAVGQAG